MKPPLFPAAVMQRSIFTWLPRVSSHTQIIYVTVLLAILCILSALPLIKVDVSIAASGIVRPVTEKTELRSMVKGEIQSIDNDFVLINNQPAFKVRCLFAGTTLTTANGVSAALKKGMTLQARFILTKRSLFQLLYDKTDDWINPDRKKALSDNSLAANNL